MCLRYKKAAGLESHLDFHIAARDIIFSDRASMFSRLSDLWFGI